MEMFCDECPHTECFSFEEWDSSRSCSRECTLCPSLHELDFEILKTHHLLVKLSKQRNRLKIKLNEHHKPSINRLPFELISQIFLDVFQEEPPETFWDYSLPNDLGGVCKLWRNITLGTPRLWTMVKIKVKACKSPLEIDVAKEWLARSRSLPLSLKIELVDCSGGCAPDTYASYNSHPGFVPAIELIRSHSARWRRVDIKHTNSFLLLQLLNNLRDGPADLEYLSVGACRNMLGRNLAFNKNATLLPRSICQLGSRFRCIGLWDMPCGFERVTYMDMRTVPIDEVCYFFANAPNLQECRVSLYGETMDDEEGVFPLPTTPIVAQHLTVLEACLSIHEPMLFCHLTLPFLRTLELEYVFITMQSDLDDLVSCLERSSPPLENFTFKACLFFDTVGDWYELLPCITSLKAEMPDMDECQDPTRCVVTEDLLAALARRSGAPVFPKLRSLHIITRGMSGASWASLCDIFRVGSQEQAVTRRNLLKEIEIHITDELERDFAIEGKVFEFFEGLKNSGITLKVFFEKGPKFGGSASTTVR